MNPRPTFVPHKPNTKMNNQQSSNIDRGTFNPYNSISKNPKGDKAEIQDKLITRIIGFAHKLQKLNETRIISRQMLKTGSNKVFLDIVGIFIKAIDHKFERVDVNTDFITEFLKTFGYPYVLSKNIFQPIGAPHTWGQCLMILQWLGQLADFTQNFELEQQDESFKVVQKNILLLNSFNNKNTEPLTSFIIQEGTRIQNQIQQYQFSIDSKKMAITNHQNAQKDVGSLEKQIQKQKQLLYRIKQELYQLQSQQKICDEGINMLQSQIAQNNQSYKQLNIELENIQYEINHQELLPEECERLKLQTFQTKNRILKVKQQIGQRKNRFKIECALVLEKLMTKVTNINELNAEMRVNRLLQHENLTIPTIKISQLNSLLMQVEPKKDSKPIKEIQNVRNYMRTNQYSDYLQRQQNLLNLFEKQIKDQRQKFSNQQQINSQLFSELEKQKSKWRQLQRALKAIQNRRIQKERQDTSLQRQIERMHHDELAGQSQLSNMVVYKKRIIEETKIKVNEVKQLKNQTIGMQEQFQEIIKRSQNRLELHEKQCLSKLNRHYELMVKMNQEWSQKYAQISRQCKQGSNIDQA